MLLAGNHVTFCLNFCSTMYLKCLLILQLLTVLLVKDSLALSCTVCDKNQCPDLNCPGGKVLDECACCMVCAKQKNEQCGGLWGILQTCDEGLVCVFSRENPFRREGVCQEPETQEQLQPTTPTSTEATTLQL